MIPSSKAHYYSASLYLLLLIALLFGVAHLQHSIWHDEGLTYQIVRGGTWGEVVQRAMTYKPMPPLYFFLTKLSWEWIGKESGLRLISLLFGLGSIALSFALVSQWTSSAVALAAAAFMVATPGLFFYFVDANPYTILIFAVLLSLLALNNALQHNKKRDWFLYWLTLILGLSAHTLFIFYAAAQWLIPWIRAFNEARYSENSGLTKSKFFLAETYPVNLVILGALLSWSAWIIYYFQSGGLHTPLNWKHLFNPDTLFCFAGMFAGPVTLGHWIQWIILPVLAAAGVFHLWKYQKERRLEWLILWILPVLTITCFIRLTLEFIGYRYALGVFPLTCLIVVLGTRIPLSDSGISIKRSATLKSRILKALFLAYLLAGLGRIAFAGSDIFVYQDWKQAADYLNRVGSSEDFIWVPIESAPYSFIFYATKHSESAVAWPGKIAPEDPLNSLINLGFLAKKKQCRTWIILPGFANSIPWIESITRTTEQRTGGRRDMLEAALPDQSPFHLVSIEEYRRIRIMLLEEK